MKTITPSARKAVAVRAFTLVELLTVIAVIAILAGILIPVVTRVRLNARASASLSNLKSIGQALLLHAADKQGRFPVMCANGWQPPYWSDQLKPYVPGETAQAASQSLSGAAYQRNPVFIDPLVSDARHHPISDYGCNRLAIPYNDPNYGFNAGNPNVFTSALPTSTFKNPTRTVVIATAANTAGPSWYIESAAYIGNPSVNIRPDDRGTGNIYCVFADGHAAAIAKSEFEQRRAEFLSVN